VVGGVDCVHVGRLHDGAGLGVVVRHHEVRR
jgi:hypothetical protein